ncbi:acyl-CoA dehydrogenase family protein [Dactylosporangium sp. NPDC051484]|uniref:acyl-CoA dehydrogenase family protein n=1 Tax=Dactylosporangium sp. NPDC051484 TaxID=3154942 RepID=UPI00344FAD3A
MIYITEGLLCAIPDTHSWASTSRRDKSGVPFTGGNGIVVLTIDGSRVTPVDRAREILPELRAHAAEVDDSAAFPVASLAALRGSGLLGLLVPHAYGGLGGDLGDLAAVAEVLASACLSTAMVWAMHSQQVDALVRYAAEPLRERVLPRIAAGEVYLASVTTEPATGGNVMTAASALEQSDHVLRLDRGAPIVTGGEHADGFLITMRDSAGASSNRVTLVYVDRNQLKLDSSGVWDPLGMRGTHSIGIRIQGDIPIGQIVGDRGEFRSIAVDSMIPAAHIGWAACWLGAAKSGYADVILLMRSKNRPKGLDPNSELVNERLARVRIDLELVNAYLRRVIEEVQAARAAARSLDLPSTQIHLNTLKVAASELTFRAVDRLIQLVGLSTGYLRTSPIPLERHFRDLRSAALNLANDRLLTSVGTMALMDKAVTLA